MWGAGDDGGKIGKVMHEYESMWNFKWKNSG